MDIFVGNLAFEAQQDDLMKLFEGFGKVVSAVIVMSKEKKVPKSRGFGFVEMSDEEQALAAIAALNGKEFMGRVLNVNPARPKTEAEREGELKMKLQLKAQAKERLLLRKKQSRQENFAQPVLNRPGTYRGGRRTRSYIKKRSAEGAQEEVKPWRKDKDRENPMRWRKKKTQSKPWQKSPGEDKPWKKKDEGARPPWKKVEGAYKSSRKPGGGFKPWKKAKK